MSYEQFKVFTNLLLFVDSKEFMIVNSTFFEGLFNIWKKECLGACLMVA